jgi:hypothetical protein
MTPAQFPELVGVFQIPPPSGGENTTASYSVKGSLFGSGTWQVAAYCAVPCLIDCLELPTVFREGLSSIFASHVTADTTTVKTNPRAFITDEDMAHARFLERVGALDCWKDDPDLYGDD